MREQNIIMSKEVLISRRQNMIESIQFTFLLDSNLSHSGRLHIVEGGREGGMRVLIEINDHHAM